jgi:hypothetical protein
MGCLAVLPDTTSINLHCTGSKDGYESAVFIQFSGKNLDYQSKSGFDAEEVIVNHIKDDSSTKVSSIINPPKEYSIRSYEAISLATPQLNTWAVWQFYGIL